MDIADHPVLEGFPEEAVENLIQRMRPFRYKPGEIIFQPDSEPPGLMLITAGRAELYLAGPTEAFNELGIERKEGEVLGEMSLFAEEGETARAIARDELAGMRITPELFNDLSKEQPTFMLNLFRHAVRHARAADTGMIQGLIRVKAEADRALKRMNALQTTGRILNSTIQIDNLMQLLLKEATRNTGADTGTIYLVDEDTGELVSHVVQGKEIREIRLPLGTGIAGYVAATGTTLNIPDAYADNRFNPEVDKQTGYRTKNMLTMPLMGEDQIVAGVIQLLNKEGNQPFNDEDERFIAAVGSQAALAIRNSQTAMKMARREAMTAVRDLATTLTESFRSPLAVIESYTQLIHAGKKAKNSEDYAVGIGRQIDRMAGMIHEVTDYLSHNMHLQLSWYSINKYMTQQFEAMESFLKPRGIKAYLKLPEEDTTICIDAKRISNVIFILVNNASDVLKRGGKVWLEAAVDHDRWRLVVVDNGSGIPENLHNEVFTPFFTHGKAHGTGLGLSIVKRVVRLHGGTIRLKSREGKGTGILMTLPRDPSTRNRPGTYL
ncbi:GAF domain-containing protein [bacterium]|nr:GAF domain-containing protein [bacterium]